MGWMDGQRSNLNFENPILLPTVDFCGFGAGVMPALMTKMSLEFKGITELHEILGFEF